MDSTLLLLLNALESDNNKILLWTGLSGPLQKTKQSCFTSGMRTYLKDTISVLYTKSDNVAAKFNYNNILAFLDETTYYALSASIQQIETALDDIMHDIETIRKKSSM